MQSIDIIRLSEKQKQQLVVLKRKTGIENWNVLCRWALCLSLADPTEPPKEDIPSDSNVEMSSKVLFGEMQGVYSSILIQYLKSSTYDSAYSLLKSHISRGIHLLSSSLTM
ncbi:DNA sulfur modification protein DndE [Rheinheimera mesophila]|uniref:DNA sulfur modification protein DndE n=1 Tax=Rheinheimera mesophila TaxID=1547515 RepID=A0A3P3QJI2_9GAMM|nr:DNA sulfur modification protein DndE [Rheinheimera mesophila]KKL02483.1 DNA sulfur modification protein DndE [Rheinheimera mesophila]RRJ21332.1 DNA sulfur modification protein DndE [Rheinheimera mesophila]